MAALQDWQLSKKTVLERNIHMFNNSYMSDIQFTCGDDTTRKQFFAHKYVLATSSPVFYAMFYGELAETKSVIHLPDADDETLEAFLRFLYTDECTSIPELALKLTYLSAKYMVPSLTECCIEILRSNLNSENVFAALELALNYDEKELVDRCWELIDLETLSSLASRAFLEIREATLRDLLSRNTLKSSELDLFQALLKWSDHQCRSNDFEATLENRRSFLGDLIYLIRFLIMSQDQFSKEVAPMSELLTADEIAAILDRFAGTETVDFKWPITKQRSYFVRVPCARVAMRTTRPGLLSELAVWVSRKTGDDWRFQIWNTSYLRFKVDVATVLHGIRLLGDADESVYEVAIEIEGVGHSVTGSYSSTYEEGSATYGFDVMLPTPLDVTPNQFVGVSVSIKEPQSYYAGEKIESVTAGDISVTYEHQYTKRGDICELILRLAPL